MGHQLERPGPEPKPIRRRQETLTTRHNHGQPIRGQGRVTWSASTNQRTWTQGIAHPYNSWDISSVLCVLYMVINTIQAFNVLFLLLSTVQFSWSLHVAILNIHVRKSCVQNRIFCKPQRILACSDSVFLGILKYFKRAIVSGNLKVTLE